MSEPNSQLRNRPNCRGDDKASTAAPTLAEQRRILQLQIDTLRDSFTDLIGENKGKISDLRIVREIECLEATKRILKDLSFRRQRAFRPIVGFSYGTNKKETI